MAMTNDPGRLTSQNPVEDAQRQMAELREAEDYLVTTGARVMVDFTGRGRHVLFEAGEMLLAVRSRKDSLTAFLTNPGGGTNDPQ